jgi:hypothetical protein
MNENMIKSDFRMLTTLLKRQSTHVARVRGHKKTDAALHGVFAVLLAEELYRTIQFIFVKNVMRAFRDVWEEIQLFLPATRDSEALADFNEIESL